MACLFSFSVKAVLWSCWVVEDRCGQAEGSFAFSLSEDGSKVTSWVLWRPSYALVFEDESQARGERFDFRWSWKAIVSRTSACWPEAMPAAVQLAAVVVSSILLSMFLTAILQKQLKMFLISDQGLVWLNLLPFVSSVALVRLRSASPCPDKPCHPSGSVAAFVVCLIAPFNHQ